MKIKQLFGEKPHSRGKLSKYGSTFELGTHNHSDVPLNFAPL